MRRSNSRSVQSSGSESTTCWKVCASAISLDPILVVVPQVATVESDYRALTERCGLLDRSERGKLALTGLEAASFLQGQVTNDVERLSSGEGCYSAFLTPKGKMLGDLRILATED